MSLDDSWYHPGGFLYGGSGGQKTKSGSAVSNLNAIQLSVVWACIKILSEDSASLPLHLYRRRKGGGKDRAWADDRYALLHDTPNPEMTAMSFREAYAAHLISWGNGFAEIEYTRGRVKKPVALWPITPNRVIVKRDEKKRIIYKISMAGTGNADLVLPKENILHTPGLSFDGLVGYPPIMSHAETVGFGMSLEEFGAKYFGEGTHPSAIVTHPGHLKDSKVVRDALNIVYSGLDNSQRLMLFEDGMTFSPISIKPEEAQFLETRKYTNVDIGTRIFRLPPQMYGEYDKASTYASAEQFAIDYVTKTLRSWLVRLEQSYNMALLDPSERGVYFYEHNIEGLLRGDILSRFQAHVLGKRNGFLNADEIRDIENLNPIPGGMGSEYIVERNMIGIDDLGKDIVPKGMADETKI
jgi:HK97 family phage portal protein